MTKAELKTKPALEPLPQLTEPQPEKFAEVLQRVITRYGDTEYEVWPNRDPRLDEIEDWQPGQRR